MYKWCNYLDNETNFHDFFYVLSTAYTKSNNGHTAPPNPSTAEFLGHFDPLEAVYSFNIIIPAQLSLSSTPLIMA